MIRLLAFLALTATAQAQETPVTPEAFLDLVDRQTVTFMLEQSDVLVGVERFIDRQRSVWTRSDGSCALGQVTARGAAVCFVYDDDPNTDHCWLPFEEGGDVYVRSTLNGEVQRLARLEKRRLECVGEPMS
ncbi:hypothetical protein [Jannaschia donghaensis]|uniref:Uncharacterized protein n=1 Tax=Jannaschia donghaensis TaxID=420998 RepID=A0A0M6YDM3_9RHOB|nr:hypothetical protein [Jannaschia donghaensis]CTQ48452.1 hypothetical protein JDO7802_00454 [Jannaschia donghaensis]